MNNTIAIIVAMYSEARPIISRLNMEAVNDLFDHRLPLKSYKCPGQNVYLVLNGKCPKHRVDRIGTQAAAISAWEAIRTLSPRLLISAGTAGGFKANGDAISDVYVSKKYIRYHSRIIPFEPFISYQTGEFKCIDMAAVAKTLDLKEGIISTGDSVVLEKSEWSGLMVQGISALDMEAAAIAEIAEFSGVDMLAIKVISDFMDVDECIVEQFSKNREAAVSSLAAKIEQLISFLV